MTLPYKYPDGRESRHVRYKFSPWSTSIGVFDLSLQYRVKGWWRYRWHTVYTIAYYPAGETSLENFLAKLLELAEDQRRARMRWKKFMKRFLENKSE